MCDDVSTSTRKLVTDQTGTRDVRGYATDDRTCTRKLEPFVDKKPQFEIDLRMEGLSQDAMLQDEAKMNDINEKLEKFKMGSCAKSIRNDLSKGKMIVSEETSRAIYEMGNMELIDLKETSATIQCLSCVKHVPEALNMCQCGVWLRPNSKYDGPNQSGFCSVEHSILSYNSNPVKREREKVGIILGRQIMPKPWMHEEEQRKTVANVPLYWTDGRTTSTELLNWCTVGLKSTSSISITSPRLT